jgi:putative aminopeptidase FrvX
VYEGDSTLGVLMSPGVNTRLRLRIQPAITISPAARRRHEQWLRELTAMPTAAGREDRVIAWVRRWAVARPELALRRDRAGNLILTRGGRSAKARPIFITAHLDHPAFVVRRRLDERTVELEFRGGVHEPYFRNARLEIFDQRDRAHRATITSLESTAQPFKRVTARLARPGGASIMPGDVGRWAFPGRLPRIARGLLHAHACDDLAGVAAALAAFDCLQHERRANVGLLLTRAEEIGFVGAIAACKIGSVPKSSRLICLENSRSFADSPIGGGPILRVGDKASVFSPDLTNRLGAILAEHAKATPRFRWQRKLMPGGTCEATVFATYGHESTCLCLPLGNYHNMADIDSVLAGRKRARVAPEFISIDDFHGLVEMLMVCCAQMDSAKVPPLRTRLDGLLKKHRAIVGM